jgi:hypothetical protein
VTPWLPDNIMSIYILLILILFLLVSAYSHMCCYNYDKLKNDYKKLNLIFVYVINNKLSLIMLNKVQCN